MIENLLALQIAINKKCTPEIAFKYLDMYLNGDVNCFDKELHFKWTDAELESLKKFKEGGMNYQEIADMYCVSKCAIFTALKNYKKRVPEGTKLKITMSV